MDIYWKSDLGSEIGHEIITFRELFWSLGHFINLTNLENQSHSQMIVPAHVAMKQPETGVVRIKP